YSGGTTSELVPSSAFPTSGLGTVMSYSPDGSLLALTMLQFPADFDLDAAEDSEDLDVSALDSVLYLIDPASGAFVPVSDATTQWAGAFSWSPDGSYLAYNAWLDTNGDGSINSSGVSDPLTGVAGDLSQIFIYDVNQNSTKAVDSTEIAYAPEFVSATQVAYTTSTTDLMTGSTASTINLYDVTSGASSVAYEVGTDLVLGIAASPDGSQVAWTTM